MYADLARQLGYQAKLASRARAAYALSSFLPRAQNPVLSEIQGATEQALTGAFLGETIADLLQKDVHGQAAVVGATTGLGRYLGGRFLPKRVFPGTYAEALKGIAPKDLSTAEQAVRAGGGFTRKQLAAGRGLGALAGLAAGLLAVQGIKHLRGEGEPEGEK